MHRESTPVEQIYISLLKHCKEARMRHHVRRHEDEVCIGITDLVYQVDGFTLTLEPFDEL